MLDSDLSKQNDLEEKEEFLSVGKSIIMESAKLFSDTDFSVCIKKQDELRELLDLFFYASLEEKSARIIKEFDFCPIYVGKNLGEKMFSNDGLFHFVDHRIGKIPLKEDLSACEARIYKMIGRSTFKDIFFNFKKNLSDISFSESQIKKFCLDNKEILVGKKKETIFLLSGTNRCHVVSVGDYDGFLVSYHDLDDYNSLFEDNHNKLL